MSFVRNEGGPEAHPTVGPGGPTYWSLMILHDGHRPSVTTCVAEITARGPPGPPSLIIKDLPVSLMESKRFLPERNKSRGGGNGASRLEAGLTDESLAKGRLFTVTISPANLPGNLKHAQIVCRKFILSSHSRSKTPEV